MSFNFDLAKTRNIGIIAHIDAGKTTTTERMLYYSGYTRRIGDVDDGSTVTDFLPAERARGITIQSAAITFHWPPGDRLKAPSSEVLSSPIASRPEGQYTINLIDTPGHADFTFEVLRSLRILDGAVCILDGVAGVEAQTEKVWAQANLYRIPRVIFVNKLDRDGAAFSRTVKEIGARLHGWPAVCQMPWWHSDSGALCGVGNVIGLRGLLYTKGSDGRAVDIFTLQELDERHQKLAKELRRARIALVELLSEHDEEMVEKFLTCDEDHLAISPADIVQSLRRCVLQSPQTLIPVFAGASFRNVGVQPLLDAVLDLMPSPTERPDPEVTIAETSSTLNRVVTGQFAIAQPATAATTSKTKSGKGGAIFQNMQACALAFKVVNDPKRGVLVYVRVYSGSLDKGAPLYNTNLGVTERAQRLLRMYANDAMDIDRIPAGHIGVIPGLKHARTGDTLIVYGNVNPKAGPPAPINSLQLRPITVPPPVFFTGVRPNSLAEEKHLEQSLQILLREDPSLSVSLDQESGQTHLAGMGELHLEIARDRLLSDFKAKATTGKIEIGYREAILQSSSSNSSNLDSEIAGKRVHAGSVATVTPLDDSALPPSGERSIANETVVMLDATRLIVRHPTLTAAGNAISPDDPSIPGHLSMKDVLSAIRTGVSAALAHVPGNGYPAHSIQVEIDLHPATQLYPDTSPSALSSATRQAVHAALKQAAASTGSVLMEPVMTVTIATPESAMGDVIHDLSSARGGQVLSLDSDSDSDGQQAAEDDTLTIDTSKIYAPPDPFEGSAGSGIDSSTNPQRQITARVPLKEMVGYLKHLRSLTGGRGTFTMSVDRFERMSSQRMKAVLNEMRGDEAY